MKNLVFFLIALIFFAAPSFAGVQAKSHATSYPIVKSSIRGDFARISFEWKEPVDFIANSNGKTVTITFDKKSNPNLGAITASLAPYITKAVKKTDGTGVILTLDKTYKTRTFTANNISGIDFLGIDPKAKQKMAEKKKEQEKLAKKAANKKLSKEQEIAENTLAKNLASLEPAAGGYVPPTKAATPENQTIEKPKEVVASTPEKPVAEKTTSEKVESEKRVIENTAPEKTIPATQATSEPAKPEVKTPPPQEEGDDNSPPTNTAEKEKEVINKVRVSTAEDSATIRFSLNERIPFAVFTRNHNLWVVIGKSVKLDLSDFTDMEKTVISKPDLIAHKKATILYMPVDDNVYISVKKEDASDNWAVLLTQTKNQPSSPIAVEINTTPPAPPHVFLPTLEIMEPISVRDPVIGDKLMITPLYKTGEAVVTARDFVEFSILETAQGIVVAQKSDDVTILQLRNGIRVMAGKSGAAISPNLPKLEIKASNDAMQANPTLFPYNLWKVDASKSRLKTIQELQQKIVKSDNVQDANNARLRIAQIYLSEGMAVEALAFLDGINRTNPSYYRTAKLAAMRGSANFLLSRFVDASKDFAAVELNNSKEMDYWRSVLSDLLGNSVQVYNYMDMNQDYISKYPPIFRQKLAIVAADRSIAAKEYNVALQIFDSLHSDNLIDSISVYINFLMAKISISTGQEKDGLETLDKLADDYKHPFVRSRAEFTRIAREMEAGTIDKDEIIERLEHLRITWHGDGLELQILTLLGELYNDKKDYVNAMRVWNNGVQGFKNTSTAIDMARKMAETFIIMFNNDQVTSNLSPLQSLALYYEYRTYMPSGTAGNEMIERLAEKLIGVDLLEQAAALLDRQMRSQSEKETRSKVGSKLATIYLLNHQPQKAISALQDSVYGENQVLLRLMRNRIAAEAMVDMEKFDIALQTLGNDDSVEADKIRASIYWKTKDWQNMASTIEGILKKRDDITAPINLDESELLIKLALAYVFQDNKEQLQYLRDYFSPLMAKNPNKKVFDFVTSQDIEPNSRNFDIVIDSLVKTRSFLDNYKARIKTSEPIKKMEPQKIVPKKVTAKKPETKSDGEKKDENSAEKATDKSPEKTENKDGDKKASDKKTEEKKADEKKPEDKKSEKPKA